MKKIIITSIMSLLILMGKAQETSKSSSSSSGKFYIGLSAGPAFPVGRFGNNDFENVSDAGLARVGYNLNLNSSFDIEKNFGLASTIFYSRYKLDQAAIDKFVSRTTTSSVSVNVDHWQYVGIVLGPTLILPINDKLSFGLKAMGGVSHVNFPVIKVDVAGTNQSLVTQEKWTDAFAWQLASDLKYNFTNKFSLFTNLGYGYMRPKWTFSDNSSVRQNMGVIDLNIGIGTHF